jgi:hypothetical protein
VVAQVSGEALQAAKTANLPKNISSELETILSTQNWVPSPSSSTDVLEEYASKLRTQLDTFSLAMLHFLQSSATQHSWLSLDRASLYYGYKSAVEELKQCNKIVTGEK